MVRSVANNLLYNNNYYYWLSVG